MNDNKSVSREMLWQLIGMLSILFGLIMTLRIQFVAGITIADHVVLMGLVLLTAISIIKYHGVL